MRGWGDMTSPKSTCGSWLTFVSYVQIYLIIGPRTNVIETKLTSHFSIYNKLPKGGV